MRDASENALFQTMREAIKKNVDSYSEILQILPAPHALAVRLDDRIKCVLTLENHRATLTMVDPEKKIATDIEVVLFSESIRRLSSQKFNDLTGLLKALGSLAVRGHIRLNPLCSVRELNRKGYLLAIQKLGSAPAHFILEMLAHRFNFLQSLLIAPTELVLKKLRNLVQK